MIRTLAVTVLAIAGFAAVQAAPAGAAAYIVHDCQSGFASAGSFAADVSNGATLASTSQCPSQGALLSGMAAYVQANGATSTVGDGAGWTFTAPAGTTIRGLAVRRNLGTRNQNSWTAAITADSAEGGVSILDGCLPGGTCTHSNTGLQSWVTASDTTSVSFGVTCSRATCSSRTDGPQAWVAIYGADVTIDDPAAPAVSLVGALASPGWHRGSEPIVVNTADVSGVQSVGVKQGATTLAARTQGCDFSLARPCPDAAASFSLDSGQLPEGVYPVTGFAVDAASQIGTSTATVLHIDRTAPATPSAAQLTANPDGTYSASWTNPDQGAAAPIAGVHYQVCDTTLSCGADTFVAGGRIASLGALRLPSGPHSLRLWLQDEAGNADDRNAASLAFVGPAGPDSGVAEGSPRAVGVLPPVLQAANLSPSRLRLTASRRSSTRLTVSGTIARSARNTIRIDAARSATGSALVRVRTTPRDGRWTATLKLPSALRHRKLYLTLSFTGQANLARATLHRTA